MKHRRFSPGIPVSSCSNTGPTRSGPHQTSRENSLVVADRVIQYKDKDALLLSTGEPHFHFRKLS